MCYERDNIPLVFIKILQISMFISVFLVFVHEPMLAESRQHLRFFLKVEVVFDEMLDALNDSLDTVFRQVAHYSLYLQEFAIRNPVVPLNLLAESFKSVFRSFAQNCSMLAGVATILSVVFLLFARIRVMPI